MSIKASLIGGLLALMAAQAAFADIQHIVVFKYKDGVAPEKKAEIAREFLALKSRAQRDGHPYIVSIKAGGAISKEGFDRGLEQAFIVTFKDEADRDYFVGKPYSDTMEPAHKALAQVVEPLLATDSSGKLIGLFVFDFDDGKAGP